jgi:hypothetical protein
MHPLASSATQFMPLNPKRGRTFAAGELRLRFKKRSTSLRSLPGSCSTERDFIGCGVQD